MAEANRARIEMMMEELRRWKDVPEGVIDAFEEMGRIDRSLPEAEKRALSDVLIAKIMKLMQGHR